jgi:hypothetical protein
VYAAWRRSANGSPAIQAVLAELHPNVGTSGRS